MKEKLLKCPFCLSEAEMRRSNIYGVTVYYVECKNVHCGNKTGYHGRENHAINSWNRRDKILE